MAVGTDLIGRHFDGRFHDLDADPRLMPVDLLTNYEDEGRAVGTQLYRAVPVREPGRAGAAGTGVPGRAPWLEAA
jgi:hypothetical protein